MRQSVEQLAAALDELLPQLQCQRCGYPSCADFADALARGRCQPNQCDPGGARVLDDLNRLTGGTDDQLDPAYDTLSLPESVSIDEAECIGCTLCIKACPVDAIVGSAKLMHTVSAVDCTGCELCVPVCPVDCIHLGPACEKDSQLFQESLLEMAPVHRAHFRQRAKRLGNPQKSHRAANSVAIRKNIADSVARVRVKREQNRGGFVCNE